MNEQKSLKPQSFGRFFGCFGANALPIKLFIAKMKKRGKADAIPAKCSTVSSTFVYTAKVIM